MLQTGTSQSAPNQTQIQNNMVVSERSTVLKLINNSLRKYKGN